MGKINDRFMSKNVNTKPVVKQSSLESGDENHSQETPEINNELVNFKYVVSANSHTITIDTTNHWMYHSNCYVPEDSRVISAGYVSCPIDEFNDSNYDNMITFGNSVGYKVGPHPRDLELLKKYFKDGVFEFAIDTLD